MGVPVPSASAGTQVDGKSPANMPTKLLLKAYASGVTTADAVLSTIVPQSSRLVGIIGVAKLTCSSSASENLIYELSLQSASQFTTNDALNVIGYIHVNNTAATAGLGVSTTVNWLGMDLRMESGSRLYVHRSVSTAPSAGIIQLTYIFA
jgi:hypothetical protein